MKNEFVLAFNEVLEEKGLPKEIVIDALQAFHRAAQCPIESMRRGRLGPGGQAHEVGLADGMAAIPAQKANRAP